ncbi:hypothetical protein [Microbacterium arborescens]|uniref:hypothetical protein n=1 Tax=Microbacterium arborescens TaxID=33883 RepID=UPI0025A14BC5|nr:hypothetical protein [Microbacterium arborescens]WJM16395.1 hypothetical protein QUC20_03490 [Microbacterium arborescens]
MEAASTAPLPNASLAQAMRRFVALLLLAPRRSRSEGARFDGDAALLERASGWARTEVV